MVKLYTVSKNKTRCWLWLDHELLIAKFRLKLKKEEKTTRPFRYNLNQTPYNYTVEIVYNCDKQIQGIRSDRQSAWRTMDGCFSHCTGESDQDCPQEKEMQKGKMVVWGGLQIAEERREATGKGEKERYTHLNAEFQGTARRVKKAALSDQCKEIEENNRMGKTRDLKKIRDTKRHFMQRWAH